MITKIEKFSSGPTEWLKCNIIAVLQFLFAITNDLKYLLKFRADKSCQKEILAEENVLTFTCQNFAGAQWQSWQNHQKVLFTNPVVKTQRNES